MAEEKSDPTIEELHPEYSNANSLSQIWRGRTGMVIERFKAADRVLSDSAAPDPQEPTPK